MAHTPLNLHLIDAQDLGLVLGTGPGPPHPWYVAGSLRSGLIHQPLLALAELSASAAVAR